MEKKDKHWKLRLDNLNKDDTIMIRLLAFCEERKPLCDLIVGVKEISEVVKKLHYHVVFHFKDTVTYYAFKKAVDRAFPEIKGSAKSVAKVKKVQTNLIYHCKGGDYFLLHGITSEQCDSLGDEWVDRKKKVKAVNHYDKIKGMLRKDRSYGKEQLALVVYYYFLGKPMNHHYMKHIVNGLYSELNKDEGYELFLDSLGIFPENKISVDSIIEDLICPSEKFIKSEGLEDESKDDDVIIS